MQIDQERIRAVLESRHAYYAGGDIPIRNDNRWDLGHYSDFIARHLSPSDRVLDVGCGKGHILLSIRDRFASGLGIDSDRDHIQMAQEAKIEEGARNVEFRLLDYPRAAAQLQPGSFDMLLSIRGPVPDTDEGIQAARRLLKPGGLLFCHEIGELHHKEVDEVFGGDSQPGPPVSALARHREALERHGFEVRLAADLLGKMYFPDIYLWLRYVCNIWAWLGLPLPEPGDPRIAEYAQRNSTAEGEVGMTYHVAWIGGVKK